MSKNKTKNIIEQTVTDKIQKCVSDLQQLIGLDPKTPIFNSSWFENEELEELFVQKLQEYEEEDGSYLLGNIDTVVSEFLASDEVQEKIFEFYVGDDENNCEDIEDEIDDDMDCEGNDEEEIEEEEAEEEIEEAEEEDEAGVETEDEAEEDAEEIDETKNHINFFIPLTSTQNITISYSVKFNEVFEYIGCERKINININNTEIIS